MSWRGKTIVDIARSFLASNGAEKHARVSVPALPQDAANEAAHVPGFTADFGAHDTLRERLAKLMGSLRCCSRKGLAERFDSTIGAASVVMPFGGARQLTPAQAMIAKLPVDGETSSCSAMAWGFDPYLSEKDPTPARISPSCRAYPSSWPPAWATRPISVCRSISSACARSPSAGASPSPRCSARWMPR